MSAPTLACALLDAIGPLLKEACASLEAHVRLDWFPPEPGRDGFYQVSIHDCGRAFMAIADTPSRALLDANSERQTFCEARAQTQDTTHG
jgi:hypothetical protein